MNATNLLPRLGARVLAGVLALSTPLAVFVTAAAHAEGEAARLVLRVEGTLPAGITEEQLRAAIAGELGVEVALAGPGVTGRGTIVVKVSGGVATVSFVTGAGQGVPRPVTLPKSAPQALEVIVLLTGNLARDEAGELIGQLQVQVTVSASTTAPSASASASASVSVPAPAPTIQPQLFMPPVLRKARGPAPVRACGLSGAVLGADFLPGVGSSTTSEGRSAVRIASFNAVGGIAHGLAGVELGGVFNAETGFACGVQIAGAANVVAGPVQGVQLSGAANLGGEVAGLQLSGGVNLARVTHGAQLATVNVVRYLRGAQLGSVNIASMVFGAQIGAVNLSASVEGAQIGAVNLASGKVSGLQLGVVNVADEVDVPIGLVSVVKSGRTHWDLVAHESGFTSIGLVHGGKHVHNVFGFGVQPGIVSGSAMPALTYGLGVRAQHGGAYTVDVDLLVATFLRKRATFEKTMEFFTVMPELRVVLGLPLFDKVSLLVGPSLRVLLSSDPDTRPQGPWSGTELHDGRRAATYSTGTAIWLIPGVMAGLRI